MSTGYIWYRRSGIFIKFKSCLDSTGYISFSITALAVAILMRISAYILPRDVWRHTLLLTLGVLRTLDGVFFLPDSSWSRRRRFISPKIETSRWTRWRSATCPASDSRCVNTPDGQVNTPGGHDSSRATSLSACGSGEQNRRRRMFIIWKQTQVHIYIYIIWSKLISMFVP